MKRFFLVDCNNFFVSCERVFNPALIGKPVVVLSNNDGCIISRSNEAKALGIGMSDALFECEEIIKKHNVQVYSSNFTLYADMAARVMQTLAELATDIEVYSIDEAFLFVSSHQDVTHYGQHIRSVVKQRTGIPISLGIGPTKTLAKIANKLVKKRAQYNGVLDITNHPQIDALLASLPVRDVWGVGRQYEKLLLSAGIRTPRDLKYAPDHWVRKKMTIMGLKTVLELRGKACIDLQEGVPAKQSITVSRSFGRAVSEKREVQEAVATYMIRAAQKLRKDHLRASVVSVFVATSRYHDHQRYFNAASFVCPLPTDYTPHLLEAAQACLAVLYKPGYVYKKVGVLLNDLVSDQQFQLSTYIPLPDMNTQRRLMKTCDTITTRFGSQVLSYASAGIDQSWKAKRLLKSAHYTTSWHELFTVSI